MAAALLLVLVSQLPKEGQAQTTLVSNVNQSLSSVASTQAYAQLFTTGTHAAGYSVHSVDIALGGLFQGATMSAAIYTVSSGRPDALLHSLTPVDSAQGNTYTFTAAAGTTLSANTDYAVVFDPTGTTIYFYATTGMADTAAVGWSLDNSYFHTPPSWTEVDSAALLVAIKGDTTTVSNSPATGKPTISGAPQVLETLTASTTDIEDDDGIGTLAYQWIQVDGMTEADITGATNNTYTPVTGDVGKQIKVEVSFTDDGGTDEALTSDAYPPRGFPAAHIGIVAAAGSCPSDSDWCAALTVGVGTQGSTIHYGYDGTSGTGTLDDTTIDYRGTSYTVNSMSVADGTADSLVIQLDAFVPDGSVFTVGGQRYTANSASRQTTAGRYSWDQVASLRFMDGAEVTVSVAFGNFPATGKPTTAGPLSVGGTLTAGPGDIADVDGLTNPGYTYQWQSVDGDTATDIPGATSSAYTLTQDDVGKRVRVTLSFTDDEGNAESRTSDPLPSSGTISEAGNNPATGAPAISGPAMVGGTLSASKGTIADADGLTRADNGDTGYDYAYQWIRMDGAVASDIAGEISSTYTLGDADLGKRIKVEVSFTDDAGNAESRTSPPTIEVGPDVPTVVIQTTSASVTEGDTALFLVRLVAAAASDLLVSTAFSQTGSFWAQAPPSSVTFAAGDTLVEVAVATVDDHTLEDNGRIAGQVRSGNGYRVGTHDSVYIDVHDDDSPLGICPRTRAVRERIMVLLRYRHRYKGDCTGVTGSDLAQLTSIDLDLAGITSLQSGDFAGLSALTYLSLDDNEIRELPQGVFSGLEALQELRLGRNQLALPLDGIFVDLSALQKLSLRRNNLLQFPFDDLETLPLLTDLYIGGNPGVRYKVQITPLNLTVSGADTVAYRVRLMSRPGGTSPVEITRHPPDAINVWPESLSFSRTNWFRSQVFSLTSTGELDHTMYITHSVTSGYYPDRAIDEMAVKRVAASMADTDEPAFSGTAEAIALVAGLSPRAAAAVLFGEAELESAQLQALDHLGNRNGRYDHGDFMSWLQRCRRGDADCGEGSGSTSDESALPPNRQGGRNGRGRRYSGAGGPNSGSGKPGGRSSGRPPAKPLRDSASAVSCRRASRWGRVAVVAVLTSWACMGDDLIRPRADSPLGSDVERPLQVTLEAPPTSRDISVMLWVQGPAIDSIRAPGLELFESEASASGGRQIIVAGQLSTGIILDIWVASGRDPADYHVDLLEVAAEDYWLRDLAGYSASVGR